jgi:DNA-binding Lrp family transcriptional regulator
MAQKRRKSETTLDALDMEILAQLKKNARTRIYKLAKITGKPPSTVHARIKALEEKGIIKRWTIETDRKLLGYKLRAIVLIFIDVTRLKELGKTQHAIARELLHIPEVERVSIITGDADLAAEVVCRDFEEFDRVLLSKIQLVEGIVKTKSLVVIAEHMPEESRLF